MKPVIRPMRPEDRNGKGYVHWQAWREAYAGLVDGTWLHSRTLAQCVALAHRFSDRTYVAVLGDEVVGFGMYGETRDADLPGFGELYALYVLQAHWGQGVGHALMNACMAQMIARPGVLLWVLKGNERAIRFYERHGLRFDGASKEVVLGTPLLERRMISVQG